MSEGSEMLASAVAVPDQDTDRLSPELTTKRRKSSIAEYDVKRRRLSSQSNISPQSQRRRPSSPPPTTKDPAEQRPVRPRGVGREEDRKRGQRLFGGLLGTLSQSSSSAAQRRRADIEKKQQEKLKSQDVEYDELKKRRKELREEVRRREKPLYEREAMQTRHANMLATAHFLKTRAEPVLYYKPWQSRPGDDSVIQQQIEEAKETIARELAEFELRYPPEAFAPEQPTLAEPEQESNEEEAQKSETNSQLDGQNAPPPAPEPESKPTDPVPQGEAQGAPDTMDVEDNEQTSTAPAMEVSTNVEESTAQDQTDAHRDDDGGEVVEDNEDTVIY